MVFKEIGGATSLCVRSKPSESKKGSLPMGRLQHSRWHLQRTNHSHSNVNHRQTKHDGQESWLWSFLISSLYQSNTGAWGGKSALTTERNEAALCTAVSRNIPASESSRVLHVCCCCLLPAGAYAVEGLFRWHDDHSLLILATPSRRTNKAQGRMRQGASPPKLQAFPRRLCFWRACACSRAHHSNDSEIGTRCATASGRCPGRCTNQQARAWLTGSERR